MEQNQYGETIWINGNGDETKGNIVTDTAKMPDGGWIVADYVGYENCTLSNGQTYKAEDSESPLVSVIKYNKNGQIEWVKSITGNGYQTITDIRTTADGKCIVVGQTDSDSLHIDENIELTKKGNSDDIFTIEYDNNGNVISYKNFELPINDMLIYGKEKSLKIADDEGSVLLAGEYNEEIRLENGQNFPEPGREDNVLLIKYNSEGTTEWAKSFGGVKDGSVEITPEGDYLLWFNCVHDSTVTYGNGENVDCTGEKQCLLFKYSKEGEFKTVLVEEYAGVPTNITSVTPTKDGGYIYGGYYDETPKDIVEDTQGVEKKHIKTGILKKYDQNNNLEWKTEFNKQNLSLYENYIFVEDIIQTQDDGFLFTYVFPGKELNINSEKYTSTIDSNNLYLIKLNETGEFEWLKETGNFVTSSTYFGLIELKDGEYLLNGNINIPSIPGPSSEIYRTDDGKIFNDEEDSFR